MLAQPPIRSQQPDDVLQWRNIFLDRGRYEVRVEGRRIDLTVTEFKLMACFLRNPLRVLSREQLLSEAWSASPDATTRTVDTHIYRLRRKLSSLASCIRTVRGVGYSLDLEP